jgi:CHAT domain-containing protein/tetratricopeptide (TPR) repeat protein
MMERRRRLAHVNSAGSQLRAGLSIALSLWLAISVAHARPDDPEGDQPSFRRTLRVGDFVTGEFTSPGANPGAPSEFEFTPGWSRRAVLTLDSFDATPSLVVTNFDGTVVATAVLPAGGGSAVVDLSIDDGARCRIAVLPLPNAKGHFALSVQRDRTSDPSGLPALRAAADYHRAAATHFEREQRQKLAAVELRALGNCQLAMASPENALDAFEEALPLVRRDADSRLTLQLLVGRASAAFNSGHPAAWIFAKEAYADALEVGSRDDAARAFRVVVGNVEIRDSPVRARLLYKRCLAVALETGDTDSRFYASFGIGRLTAVEGHQALARAFFERLADAARREDEPLFELEADYYLHPIYRSFGLWDLADSTLARTLDLARETGNAFYALNCLLDVGNDAADHGDSPGAWSAYTDALAIADSTGIARDHVTCLVSLASVARQRGQFLRAEAILQKASSLANQSGSYRDIANCLLGLSEVRIDLGENASARTDASEALRLARQAGDSEVEALGLEALATVDHDARNFEQMLADTEAALAIRAREGDQTAFSGDSVRRGVALFGLGDLDQALLDFREACRLSAELSSASIRIDALQNIAAIYSEAGRPDDARRLLQRALSIAEAVDYRIAIPSALQAIGDSYAEEENTALALRAHSEALRIAQASSSPADVLHALVRLSRDSFGAGFDSDGRDFAERAVRLGAESLDADDWLESLWCRTLSEVRLGDPSESKRLFAEAAAVFRARPVERGWVPDYSNDHQVVSSWSTLFQDFVASRIAARAGTTSEHEAIVADGFRNSARWRAPELLRGIRENASPATASMIHDLRTEIQIARAELCGVVDEMRSSAADSPNSEKLDRLEVEARALSSRLVERVRALESAAGSPSRAVPWSSDSISDVRRAIGSGRALIEWVRGTRRLFAYVLSSDDLRWYDLGDASSIDTDVGVFTSLLSAGPSAMKERAVVELAQSLYARVFASPIADLAPEVRQLVIVPTESLSRLPFDALIAPDSTPLERLGDATFVIDKFELTYAPSISALLELAHRPPDWNGAVLILADPAYPRELASPATPQSDGSLRSELRGSVDLTRLERLDHSREEALRIAAICDPSSSDLAEFRKFRSERSGRASSEKVEVLLGIEAQPAALARLPERCSVLHIAAHAVADFRSPRRSGIALSRSPGTTGLLTIDDIKKLHLPVNLVVLSSCDTARGAPRVGEGLESMARAFIYAGARGVVASQWEVHDSVTSELMSSFYAHLLEQGQSPASALRQAKLEFRRKVSRESDQDAQRHPFHWAPFIHFGLPN